MALLTQVNLRTTNSTEKAQLLTQLDPSIRANFWMGNQMGKVRISLIRAKNTLVDSKMESSMGREFYVMPTEMNTLVDLKMENLKDKEKLPRKMGRLSLLNSKQDFLMGKER